MFDAVAPTVEVASATGVATGFADFLHDFGEIDTFDYFSGSGRKLCVLRHDVAGKARRLFVVGRGVVAHNAVNILLLREIKIIVFPSKANMVTGARRVVGSNRNAVVIKHLFLTQNLLRIRVQELPVPMFGAVNLAGCLGMTDQAGLCQLRARLELTL